MSKFCIVRNTFGDRSAFLQISLEYQQEADLANNFDTYIFIDPHPDYGYDEEYENNIIINKYKKIVFDSHKERKSWYAAVDYMFSNFDYDYILTIEDDVIISKDYLKICNQIIDDNFLENNGNLLYFHIGAWEKPKGNPNKIVKSKASSRSVLINRTKFNVIKDFARINSCDFNKGNDNIIRDILESKQMLTIAPEYNRHGHFGVYGWSSFGVKRDISGKKDLFKNMDYNEVYKLLKSNCLKKEGLLKLNLNRSPRYFWDFDPNIYYENLIYPKL